MRFESPHQRILAGGGRMGERMRAFDWAATPLGAIEGWPESLKTAVRIMLDCKLPMYIAWGLDYIQLYNDAYLPVLGEKHDALGKAARQTWPEIWETVGPMWGEVMQGNPVGFDDFGLRLERHGHLENCYFSFYYSPLPDDEGGVGGVLATFVETTGKVLLEKRQAFQLEAARHLRNLTEPAAIMSAACRLLGEHVGCARVGYAEIEADMARVDCDWTDGTLPSLAGNRFSVESFGTSINAEMRAGRITAIDDVTVHPLTSLHAASYTAIDVYALLAVPLIKEGELATVLYLEESVPNRWSSEDMLLAGEMAELTWEAVERARAQQRLRDSEDHYRHTVEFNPDIQWTALPDGEFDRISSRWEEWTGTNGLGSGWSQALHPDDKLKAIAAWRRALKNGTPYDIEVRVKLRNGRYHWVHTLACPRHDEEGRIVKWYGVTQDINEHRLTLEAVSKREKEFRTLAAAVPNHAWATNPEGLSFWFNQRMREYTGLSREQLLGDGWQQVVHPEDLAHIAASWAMALATGTSYEEEFRLREGKTGTYRWFITRALPVRDEEGKIRRWIGTNTDVEDQKTITARLAHLNRHLAEEVERRTADRDRMWRLSSDLMLVARLDSTIVSTNPAWFDMLGWREEELSGKLFVELVHHDDMKATLDESSKLSQGIKTLKFVNRYRHKDGSYRWLEWTAVPDENYIHAVARDITDEREREEELRRTEQALRQSQKLESIGKLTGGVAHDFNNILQVISGNLQLLQSQLGRDDKANKRLNIAFNAVDRGAKLSSQLLAFARRQPLEPMVINPVRIAREMEDLLRGTLGETIDLETVASAGAWNALLDRHQLENVILNLAINARDAMPAGGKLTIEVGNASFDDDYVLENSDMAPGQYTMVAVSDTGIGMPAEVLEQACDPFFTTKPEGQGTGLGLSMAYGFVKQSGGHFRIYSEVGSGTTVRMYFPRSFDAEKQPPSLALPPVEGGKETILVVEDDQAVQATVVSLLASLGYRVLKADDAHTALGILKSGVPVDLLFTDVVMPGPLKSPDLARQAQELQPGIAVLFTSGYTQNAIVHGGRLDPGVQLISKPYRSEQLARKIRQILAEENEPTNPASPPATQAHEVNEVRKPYKEDEERISGEAVPLASFNILVAEDGTDAQTIMCELLMALGHRARGTTSAAEALDRIEEEDFDVLLTDYSLPDMNGVELARRARRLKPALKVVLSSGYSPELHNIREARLALLPKPYDINRLIDTLARLE